jgi:hypothetical protein
MYIPFAFFGSGCLNSSGSTFYYYNTGATTDDISYGTLCSTSSIINFSLPASNSIDICTSTIPSGVNANTFLVDTNWNVTGSCSQLFANTYRISATSQPIGDNKNIYYLFSDTGTDAITPVASGTGVSTFDVVSYIKPEITFWRSCTKPTITNLGPVNNISYPNVSANLLKNATAKIIFMQGGAAGTGTGAGASYRYLDAGNNYKEFTFTRTTNARLTMELITNTFPLVSSGTGSLEFMQFERTIPSSSCYDYTISTPTGYTFNYVDCNNISTSVSLAAAESRVVTAKANSFTFPATSGEAQVRVFGVATL